MTLLLLIRPVLDVVIYDFLEFLVVLLTAICPDLLLLDLIDLL